jgi:hypothetical protein
MQNLQLRLVCDEDGTDEQIADLISRGANNWDAVFSASKSSRVTQTLYNHGALPSIIFLQTLFDDCSLLKQEWIFGCEMDCFLVTQKRHRLWVMFDSLLRVEWRHYVNTRFLDVLYPHVLRLAQLRFCQTDSSIKNRMVIEWIVTQTQPQLVACIKPRCDFFDKYTHVMILLNGGIPWDVVRNCLCQKSGCRCECSTLLHEVSRARIMRRQTLQKLLGRTLHDYLIKYCVVAYVSYSRDFY